MHPVRALRKGNSMPICVLDAASLLGTELCLQLGDEALPLYHDDVDFSSGDQLFRTLVSIQPAAVINTAVYANVVRAEVERDRCFAINAAAVKHIAEACQLLQIPFMHVSTDQVFGADAALHRPYRETDPTCPRSVFAHSKRAGEVYATSCRQHFIVRTSALYSARATSISDDPTVANILNAGRRRGALRAACDRFCTPSFAPHVAAAMLFLLKNVDAYGMYHVINSNFTTWAGFAGEVRRQAKIDERVQPILSARRVDARLQPNFCVLDTAKYRRLRGPELPVWQEALKEYFAMRQQQPADDEPGCPPIASMLGTDAV
jgi:dTDP-4-dehydrorhamnose reductase